MKESCNNCIHWLSNENSDSGVCDCIRSEWFNSLVDKDSICEEHYGVETGS